MNTSGGTWDGSPPKRPFPSRAAGGRGPGGALGGAGNVAVNLSGLGAGVVLAGLIGADPPGREIVRMLKAHRIGISGIVIDRNRPTTTKTRVVAHSQQVVRVDRGKKEPP